MAHQGLRRTALLLASGALALGAASCGPPPAPPPVVPPPPLVPAAPAPKALGEKPWGEFRSVRFGLRVPLPDGKAWRIDDHGMSWLVASHPETGSTLSIRLWHDEGGTAAGRKGCEEAARVWRKLPDRDGADIVEKRAVNVPPDFDTQVEVGVVAPLPVRNAKAPPDLKGFVMAFGGRAHRCFAYVYITSAGGPGAEAVLGERLATMAQGSLGALKIENELDPKIEREGPPSLPGL
jgi:hypothetical protein